MNTWFVPIALLAQLLYIMFHDLEFCLIHSKIIIVVGHLMLL